MKTLNINEIVIHNSEDLIVAIPYLLGYEPKQSLCFLFPSENERFILANIPANSDIDKIISLVQELSRRVFCEKIYVLSFDADIDFWKIVQSLCHQLAPLAISALEVQNNKYRNSPEGIWEYYESETSIIASQAVLSGLQKLKSRMVLSQSLNSQIDFEDSNFQNISDAVISYLRDTKRDHEKIGFDIIQKFAVTNLLPNTFNRVLISQLIQNPEVRDMIWKLYSIHNAKYWLSWWRAIYPFAQGISQQYTLVFLGISAWLDGNGVLSNIYYEKLLTLDSDFAESCLLSPVVNLMLPAEVWEESTKNYQGFHCIFDCCTASQRSIAFG